jgi:hypothetical protein
MRDAETIASKAETLIREGDLEETCLVLDQLAFGRTKFPIWGGRLFRVIVALGNNRREYPDLPNLHRYRLDDIHRMTYSIMKTPGSPVFVWIIEAMDHGRHNELFGYRRRR